MSQNSSDLRVRRTHKLLREAFIELVEERGFDAITVGEIAQRAMVSRAAFYRYYQDKYDMVEQIFEEVMQVILRDIDALRHDHFSALGLSYEPASWDKLIEFVHDKDTIPEPWVRLFEHFAEFEHLYRVLLGRKGSPWFVQKMRSYLSELMAERFQTLLVSPGRALKGFASDLLATQMVETITWWLEEGRPYTPQQIATYSYRLILVNLREMSTW
ncbi:TetR/AcrR family transcriptional regulator [Ktedonospora formicarum]|uniref:TetR family transcriptional regulator n=1 Tax=Ktedonospora formicarum TaxID=2778364 RepID=A0A8J3I8B9_9CHLR|nr:TetR/AcrR family transcriptional regulator [Ktedonospora formicarum]GHO49321.1 TetR family transcriptional regulator [Ktedonospora formicarum]